MWLKIWYLYPKLQIELIFVVSVLTIYQSNLRRNLLIEGKVKMHTFTSKKNYQHNKYQMKNRKLVNDLIPIHENNPPA